MRAYSAALEIRTSIRSIFIRLVDVKVKFTMRSTNGENRDVITFIVMETKMPDTTSLFDNIEKSSSITNFWTVRDNGIPVKFVDMITEFRHHNNVVYASLGSAIVDLNGAPMVEVAARLRFDLGTARNLHTMLGTMIAEMLRASEKA